MSSFLPKRPTQFERARREDLHAQSRGPSDLTDRSLIEPSSAHAGRALAAPLDRLSSAAIFALQGAVGNRATVQLLATKAKRGASAEAGGSPQQIREAASAGIAGPSAPLPHLGTIQRAFGDSHDLSGIRAHVGAEAEGACAAMQAEAYASGEHIAFRRPPSLAVAAHEAAHVVQQRHGVHIDGGVGRAGDRYEASADAVANRVVGGSSASDLLSAAPTTGARHASERPAPSAAPAVQRLVRFGPDTRYLDADNSDNKITDAAFITVQERARKLPTATLWILQGDTGSGQAKFNADTDPTSDEGMVYVKPLPAKTDDDYRAELTGRLIAVTHETQHGIDHLDSKSPLHKKLKDISVPDGLRTELRAFAVQAAQTKQMIARKVPVSLKLTDMANAFSLEGLKGPTANQSPDGGGLLFQIMRRYAWNYSTNFKKKHASFEDAMKHKDGSASLNATTDKYIKLHLQEIFELHNSLLSEKSMHLKVP